MRREAVKAEADKLIEQFGARANAKARELMQAALRNRNGRLSSFFGAVVGEVERRTEASGQPNRLQ
jgi:hypothetical protein